jgi:hypothetical protein
MTDRPEDLRPSDAETKTWHEHDPEKPGSWAWGVSCEECRGEPPVPGTGPYFNIRTLQRQNITGMSSRMEEREALGDRWDDPKVGRAR